MKRLINIVVNILLFLIFSATWLLILGESDMIDISYLYVGF